MGQQEIYSFLKRHRSKWLSARDISDKLKSSSGSVINSLQRLRKSESVHFKFDSRVFSQSSKQVYVYKFKK